MLVHLIVVEVILIMSIRVVRTLGVVPILRIAIMFVAVLMVIAVSFVLNSWCIYLVGVVYIGGVVSLIVYLGGVGLFHWGNGVSWGFMGIIVILGMLIVPDINIVVCVDL